MILGSTLLISIGNHVMASTIVRATSHDYLFIISMTKLNTSQCQHHSLVGAFVRIFI